MWLPPGQQPGRPQVTPQLVRQQVVRLVPTAAVGLAPHGTTLVNIETVMWADAPHQQNLAPVTILGQRVVISLTLDHVAWSFGDGASATSGPGRAYSDSDPCRARTCPQYFGHVYDVTGSRTVSATAYWQASFTVDGGASQDVPGAVPGPAASADVAVKQARGVLVPNPDGK